jgi:hypothetical protein
MQIEDEEEEKNKEIETLLNEYIESLKNKEENN